MTKERVGSENKSPWWLDSKTRQETLRSEERQLTVQEIKAGLNYAASLCDAGRMTRQQYDELAHYYRELTAKGLDAEGREMRALERWAMEAILEQQRHDRVIKSNAILREKIGAEGINQLQATIASFEEALKSVIIENESIEQIDEIQKLFISFMDACYAHAASHEKSQSRQRHFLAAFKGAVALIERNIHGGPRDDEYREYAQEAMTSLRERYSLSC